MHESRPRRARRWLRAAIGTAVIIELLAAGGLVAVRLQGGRPPPAQHGSPTARARVVPPAGSRDTPAELARVDAARRLLERRSAAILRRDRAGFLATVDPAQSGFLATQGALFDNLANVPLSSWAYELDAGVTHSIAPEKAAGYAAPTWAPSVVLRYALTDFDPTPTAEAQVLTFVQRGASWLIASDSDGDQPAARTVRGLWDFGPVSVLRAQHTLVLGHPASQRLMRTVATEADRDVADVTAVWGPWSGRAVIVVPADQDELARIVGAGTNLTQIAALATAELPGGGGRFNPVGDRVLLNPANFTKLAPLGRRVVLSHELTHVASRADTGPDVPTWLVEGLADYVGYLRAGIDVRSAARELQSDVRAGQLPNALPTNADFDGANPRLPQVYELSWLACRLIVAQTDQASLLRLYRTVGMVRAGGSPDPVGDAFAAVLHTSTTAFTASWRSYVKAALA